MTPFLDVFKEGRVVREVLPQYAYKKGGRIRYFAPNKYFPELHAYKATVKQVISGHYLGLSRVGDGECRFMNNLPGKEHYYEKPNLAVIKDMLEALTDPAVLPCYNLPYHIWAHRDYISIYETWYQKFLVTGEVPPRSVGDAGCWKYLLDDYDIEFFIDFISTKKLILYGELAEWLESPRLEVIERIETPLRDGYDQISKAEVVCRKYAGRSDTVVLVGAGLAGTSFPSKAAKLGLSAIDIGGLFNVIYRPFNSWHLRMQQDGQAAYFKKVLSI